MTCLENNNLPYSMKKIDSSITQILAEDRYIYLLSLLVIHALII